MTKKKKNIHSTKRYKPTRKKGVMFTDNRKKFNGEWFTIRVAYKSKVRAKREAKIAKMDFGYKKARVARYSPKYSTEKWWGVFVRKT